jgi:hypothetical protein
MGGVGGAAVYARTPAAEENAPSYSCRDARVSREVFTWAWIDKTGGGGATCGSAGEAPRVHKVSPWVQNAPLGLKGLLSTPSASRAYFVRPWPFLLCSQNSPESERDRRDAKTRKERHHQYES